MKNIYLKLLPVVFFLWMLPSTAAMANRPNFILYELARAGLYSARVELAYFYVDQKQYDQAINWLSKIVAGGNASGRIYFDLGYTYEKSGQYQQALKNYQIAAKDYFLGVAANNAGILYVNGKLGHIDINKAEYWFKFAVKNGYLGAYRNLGLISQQKGDSLSAKKWYNLAIKNGDEQSRHLLKQVST